MNHVPFNPKLYALPTTTLILGSWFNDKPTYMALAWATRVNFQPPLIAISVNQGHASHAAITETGQFSLCMPSTNMVEITDYVGLVSAKKSDKSGLFEVYYGKLKQAPLIKECPLNLALKLYTSVELPTNSVFIGEIVEAWCEESYLDGNTPDTTKVQPFTLTMPDNQYWALGEKIGDAWKVGKALREKDP